MIDTIVFSGISALDFQEVRSNVLRIPEVSLRVSQAQELWDEHHDDDFSISNFLLADNQVYLSTIRLKSLVTAIVQVGLFDRYSKKSENPKYMVGNVKGDSALRCCAGEISFEEMILESSTFQGGRPTSHLQVAEMPLLSGISLAEYSIYEKGEGSAEWKRGKVSGINAQKIIVDLVEKNSVRKIVNIGPGQCLLDPVQDQLSLLDAQLLDSIDVDPLLTWFWKNTEAGEEEGQKVAN